MARKENYDDEKGVWRTIGGRKVFIKTGQRLSDAMKESGKFKHKGEDEHAESENIRMASGTKNQDLKGKSLEERKKLINERAELKAEAEEKIEKAKTPEEKKKIWREYWQKYYETKK